MNEARVRSCGTPMPRDSRTGAWPPGLTLTGVCVLLVAMCGCLPVRSRTSVIGTYELREAGQKITLDLHGDSTFVETIQFATGQTDRRIGKWLWSSGRVGLDELWIPPSFAPDYILRADSRAEGGRPKYTQPGYWSISAENHWGTVTLELFDGVSFRMVRRLNE